MVKLMEFVKKSQEPVIVSLPSNLDSGPFVNNLICHQLKSCPKTYMDIFVTEYGSQNFSINPIMETFSSILFKLKEIFRIKENYPLEDQELRIFFEYWLDLVSRYIRTNIVFDGDLYIIIDRFDLIMDQ